MATKRKGKSRPSRRAAAARKPNHAKTSTTRLETKAKPATKRPNEPAAPAVKPARRGSAMPPEPEPVSQDGPAREPPPFSIVALGASAGGLEALQHFFEHVPERCNAAFVIVTHQQAGHSTLLPELLAKHAKLPVMAANPNTRLEPNHAYVATPGLCTKLQDGRLETLPLEENAGRLPIDYFFRSLARQWGEKSVAIILSGNGSDGTLGMQEVKESNGMVMAQAPTTARYSSMPASAIATQLVDFVLPPEQLATELVRFLGAKPKLGPSLDEEELRGSLRRVMTLLRHRTGNDFSAYKKSTILRRVERRMAVHGLSKAADYARLLEHTPYEVDALFKEVLISVTSFFRDPEAFASMEEELFKIVLQQHEDVTLRGWIAGCATGEEAYSIAVLIKEATLRAGKPLKVQIFATDLDQNAIDFARTGRYLPTIAADVTQQRLERYFTKEENGYRVNKDIREMLIFATQNVIKDPPFTKLDFVSCRNLLIYLEPELQKRVLSLFAYSLNPQGVLMLGTSESISGFDDRFVSIDKKWKLFRHRENPGTVTPMMDFPAELPAAHAARGPHVARSLARHASNITPLAERVLLSHFTPPSAIISERGEVIYLHGRTGPFLEPAPGEPSHNMFNMAREGLRLELPAAVRQAGIQAQPVVRHGLQVKNNGGFSAVTLTVQRLTEPEVLRGAYVASFEIEPTPKSVSAKQRALARSRKQQDRVGELEDELQRTRENLQGTIEELETSNEELKSMNEELQSTNEELQSANEELETSREEMQSLNEELQTVNAELEERNRALSQASDDMQNLLNSTEIATVFLDDKLAIKRFTTQAKKVFSLINTDVGRPISDLAANLRYTGLVEDAREVLHTLVFREREIQTQEGSWRLMRIIPYRTHENLIDGLVITFVDIDEVKKLEQRSRAAQLFAESVVDALTEAILVVDDKLSVASANRAFCDLFRTTPRLEIGKPLQTVGEGRWNIPELLERLDQLVRLGVPFLPLPLEREFPRAGFHALTINARLVGDGGEMPRMIIMIIQQND